mgnify:CR=1 FL=1
MSEYQYVTAEEMFAAQLAAADEGKCLFFETEDCAALRKRVEATGCLVMPWHIFERIGVDPAIRDRAAAAAARLDLPAPWVVFDPSDEDAGLLLVGDDFEDLCERAISI